MQGPKLLRFGYDLVAPQKLLHLESHPGIPLKEVHRQAAQEISQRYRDRPLTGREMVALNDRIVELLSEKSASEFQEVSGAADFVKSLLEAGDYAVALATGANERSARYKLRTAGIQFEGIPMATSSDAVVREHIMLLAMDRAAEKYETSFSEIVYFGDAVWDVEATANLGWKFVGIGEKMPEGFSDYQDPEAILNFLADF